MYIVPNLSFESETTIKDNKARNINGSLQRIKVIK